MTTKQYRTAMGKTVDMGSLMIQNESVRAVGNMGVNAKGDKLNSTNKIIDRKSDQIKRQSKKESVPGKVPLSRSNASLKSQTVKEMNVDPADTFTDLPTDDEVEVLSADAPALQGGLAAAIAKAKTVQQTKLTPSKEAAKASTGVRKI